MPAEGQAIEAPRRLLVPVRLYRQIADALEARIAAGEFRAGDRLPTERELAVFYSVSRTCVREALLALEIARLVSIRVGSGVYVLPPVPAELPSAAATPDEASPTEILDARLMFEPEIAVAAATNAAPEHVARIRASLALMREEHRQAATTERGDREFHLGIAQACGNAIAHDLMRGIWDGMNAPLWQGLQKHFRSPILRLKWIEDHEGILAAIEEHDRRRARTAMRRHIENVIETLDRAAFR